MPLLEQECYVHTGHVTCVQESNKNASLNVRLAYGVYSGLLLYSTPYMSTTCSWKSQSGVNLVNFAPGFSFPINERLADIEFQSVTNYNYLFIPS